MRYKEFKEKIEAWGEKYNYKATVEIKDYVAAISFFYAGNYRTVALIDMTERFVVNLNWFYFKLLLEDAKEELFDILVEFAKTSLLDR